MTARDHWLALARWTPLAIATDLDGTLIPFAPTPDGARPDAELVAFVEGIWTRRGDRYSELRTAATGDLPRVEMFAMGG